MNLIHFLLLVTIKNINCYNPKRHTQTTSTSNSKHLKSKFSDPVIPARYKITSTTNYEDSAITNSFPAEFFPEVEYPESIVDSSKPFYLTTSPFPNDVKSTFNSLIAKENNKAIDYAWTLNEKNKEMVPDTSQKVGVNEITVTKENEINSNDKGTNETLHEVISILDVRNDSTDVEITYSDNDMDKLFAKWSSKEQPAECNDMEYVVRFINELDEVMNNVTNINTHEFNESNNSTLDTFNSEWSDELKLMHSDMKLNNVTRRHVTELNGNSCHSEEHPDLIRNLLFEDSDTNETLTSLTLLLNEYVTNASSVEDMQSDFCSVGTIANETNTSCTES